MKPQKVGVINEQVIRKLCLSMPENMPIMLSKTNIEHMKNEHPNHFEKYFKYLSNILSDPDYIAKHPQNRSIQYIKVFDFENKKDYVLVAVRASKNGVFYVRSLFIMSDEKVKKYVKKGALIEYKKG
ncbi:transposase [Anoxybacillus gonensis]|uniref:PBECR2 nuclease fold domain-containing protein n=1 Tax=Anoxybacillus gonensis TaxID=198467 RepID=A0AAW7TLW7_9BACL|nr:PBECR2 nuclease fold domain-containing protein [Anoxybacillus gonensis]AKS39542.1 transposase [Anoxybacillus gonensis]KGP59652.1 transposase [Anoxybacillus gonensis]MCX8046788.1 PBECR2 nuclease fold domain-containing protein [Anoxybacillus gonensis]MDO0878387.1 PBECR2 nuclease fold domain-containing protein [Anoxybacillus gonensis]